MEKLPLSADRLRSSAEDYLEAIALLCQDKGSAHVSKIAEMLGVQKPSVTAALRNLRDEGLIDYEQYAPPVLTKEGKEYAERVINAHRILSEFFEVYGDLSPERADAVACEVEHRMSFEEIENIGARLARENKKKS